MLVGERDYVEDDVYDDFRKAGLAHLLAISGLHMGISAFSFSVIRFGCALVPHYAMRVSVHKYQPYWRYLPTCSICFSLAFRYLPYGHF